MTSTKRTLRKVSSKSHYTVSVADKSARPPKFELWVKETMQKAYNAVMKGASIRSASARYNVPKST